MIGVFFALALGFGAMLIRMVQQVSTMNLETFLFGNVFLIPQLISFFLCGALVLVTGVFLWRYNQLMFASFNPSLARTRRMNIDPEQLPFHHSAGSGGEPLDQSGRGPAH